MTHMREGSVCQWYDPFTPPQLDEPEPVWKLLRSESPVFFSDVLGAWIVSRYEDASEVLGDPARFSSGSFAKPFRDPPPDVQAILRQVPEPHEMDMLTADPPRHARLRRFMRIALMPRRVAAMEDRISAIADGLIDAVMAEGACDFYQRFAYPFPLSVIRDLLDIPVEDAPQLNRWGLQNIQLRWTNLDHDAHLAAAQGRVDFYRYGEALIAERRRSPGDDLLSELVTESDASDDPLLDRELVGQFMTFITAGHETSANWLTMAMYHLLADRSRWERLLEDRSVLFVLVEETLRYTAPSQSLWRTATEDVVIAGVEVPAGARIGVLIGSANHDDAVFECPARFDLDRQNADRHLGFGRGSHFCVGAALARMEGTVAFGRLAERMPSLRLRPGAELHFKPNAVLRVPVGLDVEWNPADG